MHSFIAIALKCNRIHRFSLALILISQSFDWWVWKSYCPASYIVNGKLNGPWIWILGWILDDCSLFVLKRQGSFSTSNIKAGDYFIDFDGLCPPFSVICFVRLDWDCILHCSSMQPPQGEIRKIKGSRNAIWIVYGWMSLDELSTSNNILTIFRNTDVKHNVRRL